MMKKDLIVRPGEHLIFEVHPGMCRTTGKLKAGANYPTAMVLGKVTATGELVSWDPAASDGSQTVEGVLYGGVDATTAAQKGVYSRSLTLMLASKLQFKAGLNDANKAAAIKALEAKQIFMSTEIV